ncbi:MAG TPA: universal stress protein [Actinomycetales bacterium]|nr:universal stress protein [Actinomycetales bacterium]
MTVAPTTAADGPTARQTGFVLVGDDGTRYSRAAVDFAVEEASRRRLPLSVVTIRRSVMVPGVSLTDQLREERTAVREAEHRLRSTLARVRERHPGVLVEGVLLKDPEPSQVTRRLDGATLLVLGRHSAFGLPAFALDSPSMELAEAVSCPVVCVPEAPAVEPPAGRQAGPVVVGVDTGDLAIRLLQQAGEEAGRRSTGLVVVHCYRVDPGEDLAQVQAGARAAVQELVLRARLDPGVDVTIDLTSAPAAAALVERTREASLLVTGTRGLLALAGLTMGSVSRGVLDAAACPVLVVLERVQRPVHA